jgi:hypothetical protein
MSLPPPTEPDGFRPMTKNRVVFVGLVLDVPLHHRYAVVLGREFSRHRRRTFLLFGQLHRP